MSVEEGKIDENQREFYRFSMLEDAKFRLCLPTGKPVTSWGECFIVDMSGGGSRIITPLVLPVKAMRVNLEIEIASELFSLQADIVWTDIDEEKSRYRYGLKWIYLTSQEQETLVKALMRREINKRAKKYN